MKKLLSVFLVVIMSLSLTVPAFAANNDSYHVTRDDSQMRVAEESINGIRYVYTFDKSSQVLLTQSFDSDNILTSSKSVCLSNILTVPSSYDDSTQLQPSAKSHYQHTILNYEYDERFDNSYALRRKEWSVIRYLPENKDAIEKYVSAVDTLNAAEFTVMLSGGAAAVWAIVTGLTSGLTAGQVATAVGVAAADVIALNLAIDNCESVWNLYVV